LTAELLHFDADLGTAARDALSKVPRLGLSEKRALALATVAAVPRDAIVKTREVVMPHVPVQRRTAHRTVHCIRFLGRASAVQAVAGVTVSH
jgi:hypothetical protein